MATITAEGIADLLNTTEADQGEMRVSDISSNLQKYIALPMLLNRQHARSTVGDMIKFNVLTEYDDNTRWVGMFDVDNLNQVDGVQQGTVPWRHIKTGWVADVDQFAMNMGERQILDFKKTKRQQMLRGFAESLEEWFWNIPTGTADLTHPFGLYYWLTYSATEGWNGADHSSYTSGRGGLSSSTYTEWANYTANYTNVTQSDFVDKVDRAMEFCYFAPLPNAPLSPYGTGRPQFGLYTLYDPVIQGCKAIVRGNNDHFSSLDLDPVGNVTIRQVGLTRAPYLEKNETTADPIFGINWDQAGVVFLRGRELVEDPVEKAPLQGTVVQQQLNSTLNIVFTDLRTCFAIAKSDWTS